MTENSEELFERAREIMAERGCSLAEAAAIAESDGTADTTYPSEVTVTLTLKPKVARWVVQTFTATRQHSMEDRLAAFIVSQLNRARIRAIRDGEGPASVRKGKAVTVRAHDLGRAIE